ncbi:MAG: adenylate/guanylate cyclase domain-containing protein [Candidatus Omnitrophica bacterium]|nr:adenylate/guanylate cyclase domain-containing protein [Candidatus Omnitrophota bacterium]MCM8827386.1 adenylate/guanylate cyclase domain-containing protein [Candidatus Omnitrophota bacterium]
MLLFSSSKTYQSLEFKFFDLRFILRGSKPSFSPLLHIDVNDASVNKLGRWPWPRSYHAQLIDILKECQAKAVLMDILFTERMVTNPQEDEILSDSISRSGIVYLPFYFLEEKVSTYPELENILDKDITVSLEDASKSLNVEVNWLKNRFINAKRYVIDRAVKSILRENYDISLEDLFFAIEDSKGWFLFPEEEGYIRDTFDNQKSSRIFANRFAIDYSHSSIDFLPKFEMLLPPISEYVSGIKGTGYINAQPDHDGVMRRVPLFIKYEEDKIFPQVAMSVLLDFLNVKNIEIGKNYIILKGASLNNRVKDIKIPLDKSGSMIINWIGKWETCFQHISYYYILSLQETRQQISMYLEKLSGQEINEQDKMTIDYLKNAEQKLKEKITSVIKDKICFVGLTATGTQDLGPIPFQTNYPLVGLSSNLIDTIFTESFIREAHWLLNVFIIFITALVIGLTSLFKLWKSLLITVSYYLIYFLLAFFVFVKFGLWLDMVGPSGVVIFGFSAITTFRFFTEQREKFWIKNVFSHYLSQEVINELMNDPSKLKLGGERRNITVLFSDVRGFTKFSESHQPEEVVAMLNEILTEQVKVVFKYNGTLDKFVGDELMAFFGAPSDVHVNNHAIVAVRVALEIQSRLKQLRERWINENKEPLEVGIGINSGDMVVGNMGSAERMDYTVIGDNVNLAARLCSSAGGGEIIISEATYQQVKELVNAEKLPPIMVKGKSKPISIYRVIGLT